MFVPTRSSKIKQKNEESCETVVYESKKRKKETFDVEPEEINQPEIKPKGKKEKNYEMKKLRYEVIKFGSSGFDNTKKEQSMIALAVSLGAKAPKQKRRNYKDILAEKKAKLAEDKRARGSLIKPIGIQKKKPKRNINESKGLLDKYGKIHKKKPRT